MLVSSNTKSFWVHEAHQIEVSSIHFLSFSHREPDTIMLLITSLRRQNLKITDFTIGTISHHIKLESADFRWQVLIKTDHDFELDLFEVEI